MVCEGMTQEYRDNHLVGEETEAGAAFSVILRPRFGRVCIPLPRVLESVADVGFRRRCEFL
jgi:hypothetical protein